MTATIYVDGRPSGTAPCFPGPLRVNDLPLYLGSHYNGGIRFHGVMDDVSLYDRAPGQDEIAQLFLWGGTPEAQCDYFSGERAGTSGSSGDPVDTATGSLFHSSLDLTTIHHGRPLTFVRYYNSNKVRTWQTR